MELTDHHRQIYDDPSIGGDDPGTGFDDYLATPERIASWVAELAGSVEGLTGGVEPGRTGRREPVVVTAGRRGQEIGQLLIERVVSGAASRGHEYLAVRRPAARNISTIREFHDAGFRTRPGIPAPTRRPVPVGRGRQALMDETAPNGCSASFELYRPTARASLHTRQAAVGLAQDLG